MSSIRSFLQTDPAEWVFQPPMDSRSGRGKTVYINSSNNDRANPRFQLNKCRVPWGADPGLEPRPENTRWNLELSIDDPEMQAFFQRIDDLTLDWLHTNGVDCFGKETSRLVLDESGMYRKLLQQNNPDYAPLCRTKFIVGRAEDAANAACARKGRNRMTNVYVVTKEEDGQVVEYTPGTKDDLTPNSMVVAQVEVGGMWFVTGKCGMSLVATDILVWPCEKERDFPFEFAGAKGKKPSKVDRNDHRTYDPFELDSTVINMPPSMLPVKEKEETQKGRKNA